MLSRSKASPHTCCRWQGPVGVGEAYFPYLCHPMRYEGGSRESCHAHRPDSPVSLPASSAVVSCPGTVQGLLSLVLLPVGGCANSPILITSGPDIPPVQFVSLYNNFSSCIYVCVPVCACPSVHVLRPEFPVAFTQPPPQPYHLFLLIIYDYDVTIYLAHLYRRN